MGNFLKQSCLRMDLFACSANLRSKQEPAHQTLFGGVLSILMIAAFIGIFWNSFINILNKIEIQFTNNFTNDPHSNQTIDSFPFAIGIQGINVTLPVKFFEIDAELVLVEDEVETVQFFPLVPCTLERWSVYDAEITEQAQHHGITAMMCPQENASYPLKGYEGFDQYQLLRVRINQCVNSSQITCATPAEIDNQFTRSFEKRDFMRVNFFLLDYIVSPGQKNTVTPYLQSRIFLHFTKTEGSYGQMHLSQYEITTDQSIWPFTDEVVETGYHMHDYRTNSIELHSTHYVKMEIFRSTRSTTVSRTHGKLDDMLSYVGGLFSLIFVVIAFFTASYSEICYQLEVSKGHINEESEELEKFNFLTYIQYSVYDWLKSIGCPPNWKRMEKIDRIRTETNDEIDTRKLVRNMAVLSKFVSVMLSPQQKISLEMSKRMTIEEAEQNRMLCEYLENYEENCKKFQNTDIRNTIDHSINDLNVAKIHPMMPDENKKQSWSTLSEEEKQYKIHKKVQRALEKMRSNPSSQTNKKLLQMLDLKDKQFDNSHIIRSESELSQIDMRQYRNDR